MAEDGPIDLRYPLDEIDGGYGDRTKKNVEDADGTVAFFISDIRIRTLNVAGPRQSHCPSIYQYVYHTVQRVIEKTDRNR
jgi:hypothetical protein